MGYSVVKGVRLAWQQMGEGPDLVLLHGLAANRAFCFPLAARLRSEYRVTLFDLRGHGYSERAPDGYTSIDMGRDLLGVMDTLGIAQASVTGHSYGGGAALEAAVLAPSRFERLALLDVRVQALQPQMRLQDLGTLSAFEQAVLDRSGGALAAAGETQIGLRFLEEAARQKCAGLAFDGQDEFIPFGAGNGALRTATAWLELLDRTRARADFTVPGASAAQIAALDVPVLLMYGERSRCWPSARALVSALRRAELVTVPGAGHFFPLSESAFTLEHLRRFLQSPLEITA